MNENLNLVEILKDCPQGTKLYSIIYGEVKLKYVERCTYPIVLENMKDSIVRLTQDGRFFGDFDGECTLFPSREQRDWSKFRLKKGRFDPKTLQPFDKVLARDLDTDFGWCCLLFSHYKNDGKYPCVCVNEAFNVCIPYNEDTKHLVGTTEEAPEYYRYWED